MKVTLDLDKLLAEGSIDRGEYDKLLRLSSSGTMSMALSLIIGFGVIAVSLGVIALVPDATTGLVIGTALLGAGLFVYASRSRQWEIVASICVLVGALTLAGGVIVLTDASIPAMLGIAAAFAVLAVVARSGMLAILAVLALSSSIGARTGYMHATYFLGIEEPTVTVVMFSILALATFLVSLRLPHDYARVAIMAARASVFLANFGFWIGSLWGDTVTAAIFGGQPETAAEGAQAAGLVISDRVFVIGWAVALVATGAWAVWADRRWVVTVCAVFGMIHFYTQWFEWFGPNPLSILLGGLGTLALALVLWRFNKGLWSGSTPAAG